MIRVLNELTRIDPLKWVDDLLCLLRYGPGVKLTWAAASGWPGGRVEPLLQRYGVRVFRRQYSINGSDYGLHVLPQQAAWADYILRTAGCPLTSAPLSGGKAGRAMPKAWGVPARPVGFAGRVIDFLQRF